MKQILQQFTLRASLLVMLLIGAIGNAWGEIVTYKVTSKTAVTIESGNAPSGSSVTFVATATGGDMTQMTSGNSQTLTIAGFSGYKITNLTLSMKSNSSKGAGKLSYSTDGGNSFTYIVGSASSGVSFNNSAWHGSWSTTFVDVSKDVTIEPSSSDLIIKIESTTNSLYCKSYTLTYESNGSTPSLEESDLAITGSPVTLNFDLYNNSSAQTVNYTTSSTGAVTVSGGTGYVTTSVNSSTKEISITPTAVTPSTQTITISQAEDGNYAAGTATFTVSVTDSTPISSESGWIETDLSALTANDIFVIVGNNGNDYALSNDKGTSSAPTAVAVTIAGEKITSTVNDNIKWTIGGNATDGYTFYPNGSTATWLYCTNTNNGVRVGTNDNKTFTVSENGYLKHVATSRYIGIYDSQDWRCYTSEGGNIGNQSFRFYKYVGSPEPAINASDVNIAYDATSGSITYTVENSVIGGTLTAATEDEWLTIETIGTTVPFTCEANTNAASRTATVTLTYTYNTNQTKTKEVIITQAGNPNFVNNISDIVAENTSYAIRGTIVAKSARGLVFGDGTGYVYYYNQSYDQSAFNVGDVKKISGTIGSYNHVYQFTNSATIETAESSNYNNTPTVQILDASAFTSYNEGLHLSDYVQFEGKLIKSNNYYNIQVDGLSTDASISYPTTEQAVELDGLNDKTVRVKGYFAGVSGGHFGIVLESVEEVAVQHEEYTLTVGNLSHVNTFVFDANDDSQLLLEGEGSVQILDGTEVLISVDVESDYQIESLMVDGVDVKNQIDDSGTYTFTMPDHNVTISATAIEYVEPTTATYVLATSITSGKHYIIVNQEASKAMGEQKTNNRAAVEVQIQDQTITVSSADDVHEFLIESATIGEKSGYSISDVTSSGYLYAASSSSNNLKTQATNNTNGIWSITFNEGAASIVAQGSNTRNVMQYNNGSSLFACYSSASQKPVYLYEKVESTPEPETIPVSISAAGYSTLYYGTKNLVVPEGMEAYTVKVTTQVEFSTTYNAGDVIPAGTGVVLKAAEGTYEFAVTAEAGTQDDNNMLHGNDEKALTTGGTYYYALTLDKNGQNPGFYWMVAGGGAYEAGAHKAYLALDKTFAELAEGASTGVKGFLALPGDGIVTGIESMNVGANAEIYNLAGQRVKKMQKGIYVVGGKKVMAK